MAEKSRAEELHDEYRRKVWDDLKSGSENFDKYLLTYSSGALALSLSFIKEVVPLDEAICKSSLIASWIAFLFCILVTLISFRISIRALERMVPHLNKFYLEGDAEAFDKHLEDPWAKAVEWCANLGILFFVLGLIFTMIFVGTNMTGVKHMSHKDTSQKVVPESLNKSIKAVPMTPLTEGVKLVSMTQPGARGIANDGINTVGMTPLATGQVNTGLKTPTMTPVQPTKPSSPTTPPPKK